MIRTTTLVAALTLGHALTLAGDLDPPPGPVAPTMLTLEECCSSTPITTVPITLTQPGPYHLAADLVAPSGLDAITIDVPSAGHVVIDFRGHTLSGPATAETLVLIKSTTLSDVTLKRGILRGGKRLTKAELINEASRMKVRPLHDRILHMQLADCAFDAVTSEGGRLLTIEDSTITGAGGHAVFADTAMAVIRKLGIYAVGGDGIHIPVASPRQTREHILLARQVSIIDTDGDAIDALDTAANISQLTIQDAGGNGASLGKDADCYKDISITLVSGDALRVGDNATIRDLVIADAGGDAIIAGHGLHLSNALVHGRISAGSYINFSHVTNAVDVDTAGFTPSTFADGDHIVRNSTFIAHGSTTTSLPAFEFLGEDVSVQHSHFLMPDQPTGPPTLRMPPHWISMDGLGHDFHHNTVKGIHPGTEGLLLSGADHDVAHNTFHGIGQNAIGIIIDAAATGCIITDNRFLALGPAGTPVSSAPGGSHVIGPIVTPSGLSGNCNPDRNLHVPN